MAIINEINIGLNNNYSITAGLTNAYVWVYQKPYVYDLSFIKIERIEHIIPTSDNPFEGTRYITGVFFELTQLSCKNDFSEVCMSTQKNQCVNSHYYYKIKAKQIRIQLSNINIHTHIYAK